MAVVLQLVKMLTVYKLYFPFERAGTSLASCPSPMSGAAPARIKAWPKWYNAPFGVSYAILCHFSHFLLHFKWPSASGTSRSSVLTQTLDAPRPCLLSLSVGTQRNRWWASPGLPVWGPPFLPWGFQNSVHSQGYEPKASKDKGDCHWEAKQPKPDNKPHTCSQKTEAGKSWVQS